MIRIRSTPSVSDQSNAVSLSVERVFTHFPMACMTYFSPPFVPIALNTAPCRSWFTLAQISASAGTLPGLWTTDRTLWIVTPGCSEASSGSLSKPGDTAAACRGRSSTGLGALLRAWARFMGLTGPSRTAAGVRGTVGRQILPSCCSVSCSSIAWRTCRPTLFGGPLAPALLACCWPSAPRSLWSCSEMAS